MASQGMAVYEKIELCGANPLRHTFATKVRAVAGFEEVRTLLGHSEIGTSEIYAERDYAIASAVILAVG